MHFDVPELVLQPFVMFGTLQCKTTIQPLSLVDVLMQVQTTLVDETFIASATQVAFYPMKVHMVFIAQWGITDFATSVTHVTFVGMYQSIMNVPLLYTLKSGITFFDFACEMVFTSILPFYILVEQFELVSLCRLYTWENVNLPTWF